MTRREFLALLGGGAVNWPLVLRAQQPDLARRIGVLISNAEGDPQVPSRVAAFQEGLERLGWRVGRNLKIDYRWGGSKINATSAAAEFLSLTPDVIVAEGRQPLEALRNAALTIPIVFMEIDDPVFFGFIKTLPHPGGNMTGFTGLEPTVGAKWLELLKEVAPSTSRIAVIFNPRTAPGAVLFSRSAEAIAQTSAVEVVRAPVTRPEEIEAVIRMLAREPGGGLILPIDTFTQVHRNLILDMANRDRLPAISGVRDFAAAGGLASYGIELPRQFRQAAGYVNRILRGERPADLPVQPPTEFGLVINRKTAQALDLEITQSLLARADEVIG